MRDTSPAGGAGKVGPNGTIQYPDGTSVGHDATRHRTTVTRPDGREVTSPRAGSEPIYRETEDAFIAADGTRIRGTDPNGLRGKVNDKGDIQYSDGTTVYHDEMNATTLVVPGAASSSDSNDGSQSAKGQGGAISKWSSPAGASGKNDGGAAANGQGSKGSASSNSGSETKGKDSNSGGSASSDKGDKANADKDSGGSSSSEKDQAAEKGDKGDKGEGGSKDKSSSQPGVAGGEGGRSGPTAAFAHLRDPHRRDTGGRDPCGGRGRGPGETQPGLSDPCGGGSAPPDPNDERPSDGGKPDDDFTEPTPISSDSLQDRIRQVSGTNPQEQTHDATRSLWDRLLWAVNPFDSANSEHPAGDAP